MVRKFGILKCQYAKKISTVQIDTPSFAGFHPARPLQRYGIAAQIE
ncbi:MAG: hypothetical protein ACJASV_001231 [Pseudorhodobacter sp.]|jgi:hypothetical protein